MLEGIRGAMTSSNKPEIGFNVAEIALASGQCSLMRVLNMPVRTAADHHATLLRANAVEGQPYSQQLVRILPQEHPVSMKPCKKPTLEQLEHMKIGTAGFNVDRCLLSQQHNTHGHLCNVHLPQL